jgi:hypothetical protein
MLLAVNSPSLSHAGRPSYQQPLGVDAGGCRQEDAGVVNHLDAITQRLKSGLKYRLLIAVRRPAKLISFALEGAGVVNHLDAVTQRLKSGLRYRLLIAVRRPAKLISFALLCVGPCRL